MPKTRNKNLPGRNGLGRYLLGAVVILASIVIGLVVVHVKAAGLVGDLNDDGVVNVLDLSILLSDWGQTNAAIEQNLGQTGPVGVIDLSILLSHWGDTASTPTPSPSPSPVAAGCVSGGVVAPCIGGASTGASGWGTPIFDDEFNGTSLNTSNWSTGWFGSGITGPVNSLEDDCYNPDLVSISGGYLDEQIIQQTCTGRLGSEPYSAGYITSMTSGGGSDLFGFTYGFIEARIYFPAASNGEVANWPAFWLQSLHDGSQTAPNTEIDIEEGLHGALRWHVLGAGGTTVCTDGDTGPGWHTIGLDWQPGSATFYYDGVAVGSTCTSSALDPANTGEMRIALGEQTSATIAGPQTAPQTMQTDYVRVWPTTGTVYTYDGSSN